MTAPEFIITYHGIDGQLTYKPIRERSKGWSEFYMARMADPKACLYYLRQDGYPDNVRRDVNE